MHAIKIRKSVLSSLIAFLIQINSAFSQNDIKTNNTSSYLGDDRWAWKVFLQASDATLNNIRSVTYTLDESFSPNRITIYNIGDPNTAFALSSNGWGAFVILIQVNFKNGYVSYLKHQLKFLEIQQVSQGISTHNSSKEISPGWWSWTVYITASRSILDQIRCVEYKLHETFPDPIQLVCEESDQKMAFPLTRRGWGGFMIQLKIIYTNGRTQILYHDLVLK